MLRVALALAMTAALAVAGCTDPYGITPDEDYNFETVCRTRSTACGDCCTSLGAERASVLNGICGCAELVEDRMVCGSSGSGECARCCQTNGFDNSSFSGGSSGSSCSCTRLEPTPSSAMLMDAGPRDGCVSAGQACTCINTGSPGMCGTGPDFPGLYCRCP